MREQMLASAREAGLPVSAALILGHANGYMEYVTTAEEYSAQYYEGGSTIYGPGEAAMFGRTLARLAASVSAGDSLPATAAPSLDLVVGHQRHVVPRRSASRVPPPRIERVWCSGGATRCTPGCSSARRRRGRLLAVTLRRTRPSRSRSK